MSKYDATRAVLDETRARVEAAGQAAKFARNEYLDNPTPENRARAVGAAAAALDAQAAFHYALARYRAVCVEEFGHDL